MLPEGHHQGEKTWSAFDVVGHLIHGERTDWMARARMVLQFGKTQAFEPFDRWGRLRESRGKSLDQLLNDFARLRSENLGDLQALNLRQEDLERRGRHPALGIVTLSELLATSAALQICGAATTPANRSLPSGINSALPQAALVELHETFLSPFPLTSFGAETPHPSNKAKQEIGSLRSQSTRSRSKINL